MIAVLLSAALALAQEASPPTTPGASVVAPDRIAPDKPVTLLTLTQVEQLFDNPATRAVAMVFVLPDCPIANSYAPEYSRLYAAYAARGIPIVLLHVDPDLTESAAREHARKYALAGPLVLDREHVWAQRAGATKTPEAVIFSRDRDILYRGRIDNRYASPGKRRPEATVHDLRDALAAVLAGRPVPQSRTTAVGCPIPMLESEDVRP